MKYRKYWSICLFFFVLMGFGLVGFSYAQDAQCGNGMIQRLKAGSIGRVPLDEPTPSTLRNQPGGQGIGYIQPGETFAVLDGPQCTTSTGTSWWYVQKSDLSEGWVSEGNKGDYWLEVFTPEMYLETRNGLCKSALPPRLAVGHFAHFLTSEIKSLSENIESGVQLYTPSDQWLSSQGTSIAVQENEEFLVVEGPTCFEGNYVWRLQSLNLTNKNPPLGNGWHYEAIGNDYILEASTKTLPSPSVVNYSPVTTSLSVVEAAPIIDAQHQVGFLMAGGPDYCDAPGTSIYYAYPDDNWSGGCIEIVFFPNTTVEIRFYEPNGTLYKDMEVVTSLQSHLGLDNFNVGTLLFAVPRDLKLPSGIWRIDYLYNNVIIGSTAYELKPYPEPVMEMGCDGVRPEIKLTGFKPFESVDLLLTRNNTARLSGQEIRSDDRFSYFPSNELYRWNITVGPQGELAAHIEFPLRKDNEKESLFFQIDNIDVQAKAYPPPCVTSELKSPDFANLLAYGDISSSYIGPDNLEVHYMFTGRKGEYVDITAVGFISGKPDLLLQLKSADGTLLAENDNLLNPHWGQTDPEIADYRLAENGDYHIVVKFISGGGWFTLMLNHPQ